MTALRFGFLRMCFIVVPQVVDDWAPQVGDGVVPQVVDVVGGVLQVGVGVVPQVVDVVGGVPQVGNSVAPQVVDIAVGRSGSCSSCGSVSAIWRICL